MNEKNGRKAQRRTVAVGLQGRRLQNDCGTEQTSGTHEERHPALIIRDKTNGAFVSALIPPCLRLPNHSTRVSSKAVPD